MIQDLYRNRKEFDTMSSKKQKETVKSVKTACRN